MIFTAFLSLQGWRDCAIEGNGRSARDEGNEAFRRGAMHWAAVCTRTGEELPARGEETVGRDMTAAEEMWAEVIVSNTKITCPWVWKRVMNGICNSEGIGNVPPLGFINFDGWGSTFWGPELLGIRHTARQSYSESCHSGRRRISITGSINPHWFLSVLCCCVSVGLDCCTAQSSSPPHLTCLGFMSGVTGAFH